jgi:polyferredoxin
LAKGVDVLSRSFLNNRRPVQFAVLLVWAVAPFLDLFRIDVISGRLYLFTLKLWLKDSYLFLLAFLTLVFLVLFLAKIFGRAACGWLCPRNTLLELVKGDGLRKVLKLAGLGVGTSMVIVSYFIDPGWLLSQIIENRRNGVILFCLVIAILILCDFFLAGHKFCQNVCPYGIIQYLFTDENTLQVQYHGPCPDCGNCHRSCYLHLNPQKIDRRGCVSCGKCVAACRAVTASKNLSPFLSFDFGGKLKPRLNCRRQLNDYQAWGLGLAFLFFAIGLSWGILHYQPIEVVLIKQSHQVVKYDTQGKFHLAYQIQINNGSGKDLPITVDQQGLLREAASFFPADSLILAGNQTQEILLVVAGSRDALDTGNHQFQVNVRAGERDMANLKLNFFLQEVAP